MIFYKTEAEVALMKQSAVLVSKTLAEVAKVLKPGITTMELIHFVQQFVQDHKALLSFKNYHGYPHNICASVNEVVVHGFPNKTPLKEGDVVSIDIGVISERLAWRSCLYIFLGEVSDEILQLVRVTKESIYKGIEKASGWKPYW